MYLPPQVIKRLVKYIQDGCELTMVEEEYLGKTIHRWIANNDLVLWSGEPTDDWGA